MGIGGAAVYSLVLMGARKLSQLARRVRWPLPRPSETRRRAPGRM